MNWMIFTTEDRGKEVHKIAALLQQNNAEYSIYILDENILQFDIRKISKDESLRFFNALFKATEIIILGPDSVLFSPFIMYVLGHAFGKQIPLFLSGASNSFIQHTSMSTTVLYISVDELVVKLEQNFPLYVAEETKKSAHRKLFNEGIPFTPDCFSFHIAKNNFELCELFYEAGMGVNERDSAGTPMLSVASRAGRKEMIQWLIKKGADINAISQDRGYSALMDAVWKSNYDIVSLLVDLGADVNIVAQDGQSILVLATGTSNIRICELLAMKGADPLLKDKMGMSALDYAKLFKKELLVRIYEECLK